MLYRVKNIRIQYVSDMVRGDGLRWVRRFEWKSNE